MEQDTRPNQERKFQRTERERLVFPFSHQTFTPKHNSTSKYVSFGRVTIRLGYFWSHLSSFRYFAESKTNTYEVKWYTFKHDKNLIKTRFVISVDVGKRKTNWLPFKHWKWNLSFKYRPVRIFSLLRDDLWELSRKTCRTRNVQSTKSAALRS